MSHFNKGSKIKNEFICKVEKYDKINDNDSNNYQLYSKLKLASVQNVNINFVLEILNIDITSIKHHLSY